MSERTNDGDTEAAIERVRRVVVRVASGWIDQTQTEYEAAVVALDLITTTLSEQERLITKARDEREAQADAFHEAVRRESRARERLSEQEAELERYREALRSVRRAPTWPEVFAIVDAALTQDSPEEGR